MILGAIAYLFLGACFAVEQPGQERRTDEEWTFILIFWFFIMVYGIADELAGLFERKEEE